MCHWPWGQSHGVGDLVLVAPLEGSEFEKQPTPIRITLWQGRIYTSTGSGRHKRCIICAYINDKNNPCWCGGGVLV
eukprot:15455004-Alexandrium_andersonii.AAC.1